MARTSFLLFLPPVPELESVDVWDILNHVNHQVIPLKRRSHKRNKLQAGLTASPALARPGTMQQNLPNSPHVNTPQGPQELASDLSSSGSRSAGGHTPGAEFPPSPTYEQLMEARRLLQQERGREREQELQRQLQQQENEWRRLEQERRRLEEEREQGRRELQRQLQQLELERQELQRQRQLLGQERQELQRQRQLLGQERQELQRQRQLLGQERQELQRERQLLGQERKQTQQLMIIVVVVLLGIAFAPFKGVGN